MPGKMTKVRTWQTFHPVRQIPGFGLSLAQSRCRSWRSGVLDPAIKQIRRAEDTRFARMLDECFLDAKFDREGKSGLSGKVAGQHPHSLILILRLPLIRR